jgi:hypothetical protein
MTVTVRQYSGEADYEQMRELLVETFVLAGPLV